MKPIENLDDIIVLVNTFYDKIQEDDLLGPIFNGIIKDKWPEHLEKMYTFWQTVLLGEHTYYGSPFPPHAKMPIDKEHFDQWLKIFRANLYTHFEGEKADEAMWRAEKMAQMFNYKINYIRDNAL